MGLPPRPRPNVPDLASPDGLADAVRRYADLVYSAALRRVGDVHLAEDVTQAVFLTLARRPHAAARSARRTGSPAAWLLATVRRAAADALKLKRRRTHHEQHAMTHATALRSASAGGALASSDPSEVLAWRELAPILDDALLSLPAADRDALLLRYFEQRTHADVAAALGVSEAAARQRISRGLRKLRARLERRGVEIPAAVLAGLLAAHVVRAAPAHVAAMCLSAISGGAAAVGTTGVLTKGALAMSKAVKLKTLWAAATVRAVGGTVAFLALGGGEAPAAPAGANQAVAPNQPASQPADDGLTEIDRANLPPSDEVIARDIPDGDYLDLDTGRVYRWEEATSGPSFRATDVEASTRDPTPGLRGFGLVTKPVVNDVWERHPTPEQLHALWQRRPAYGEGEWMDAIPNLPRTFLFRTDEGAGGILQVLEIVEGNDGQRSAIRARYKILVRGEGRTVAEQTAPNPASPRMTPEMEQRATPMLAAVNWMLLYREKHGRLPPDLATAKAFAGEKWPAGFPEGAIYIRPNDDPARPQAMNGPMLFEAERIPEPTPETPEPFVMVIWDSSGCLGVEDQAKLDELLKQARSRVFAATTQPS